MSLGQRRFSSACMKACFIEEQEVGDAAARLTPARVVPRKRGPVSKQDKLDIVREAMPKFRLGDPLTDREVAVLLERFHAIAEATTGITEYAAIGRVALMDANRLREIGDSRLRMGVANPILTRVLKDAQ